ncbi:MAG: HsdM family class I SAM-dependent methyltransferase [Myxococcota bacterium]
MNLDLRALRMTLIAVGYRHELVVEEMIGNAHVLVGYAQEPLIARNSCVAVMEAGSEGALQEVVRITGVSVVAVAHHATLDIWKAALDASSRVEALTLADAARPSADVRVHLEPGAIHRAKTYGRFDGSYQLDFVDIGLLPRLEEVQGADLQRLLERIVAELRSPGEALTDEQRHQVLTIAFWILAARMLRDHQVPAFLRIDPSRGRDVLEAVAQHYRGAVPVLAYDPAWRPRVVAACRVAWAYGLDLRRVGPEAIGYVYESSLIAAQTRKDLGTHSTPPYLVEYVVGRLRSHLLAIPAHRRQVVEPACGHGAFLVAALRVLAEGLPDGVSRHEYLRTHLRGIEFDAAAKEMARVSLTLADVPNPDGWDLREADMFKGDALEQVVAGGTLLLSNPPFEDFEPSERAELQASCREVVSSNKAAEMLRRAMPQLAPDALIGVIVPRQFLFSPADRPVRSELLKRFQILEVCTFPDKVFRFSSHECAVILAKGCPEGTSRSLPVQLRRVRETDISVFRVSASVTEEEAVPGAVIIDDPDLRFAFPEQRRLWTNRTWRRLGDLADVGQGLSHHGWVQKSGHATVREQPFENSALGLKGAGACSGQKLHEPPLYCHIDVDPAHVRRALSGLPTGKPQVVVNYHPHSRGPWRLMAHIDSLGAAVPSTWLAVRPKSEAVSVELLWAICNSPFANAFIYAHCGKRDIPAGTFERLPIPYLTTEAETWIANAVRRYFVMAREGAGERDLRTHILGVDRTLLAGYGLFAPAEQRICSLFAGQRRPGLTFDFTSYGSPDRLPAVLSLPASEPDFPLQAIIGEYRFAGDVDADIDDGRQELAALRRAKGSGSTDRILRRERFVRNATRILAEYAAARWIDEPARRTMSPLRLS